MRILKSSAWTLTSPTFVGSDQETGEDCASTPTCAVTREDGTSLTAATVTNLSTPPGVYTAAITTTHTSQLDRLLVTWTGTAGSQAQVYTDQLEVVSAHYCTLPEIRARLARVDDRSDPYRYPIEMLLEERDAVAAACEDACGVSWVRRYHRETLYGNGTSVLPLKAAHPRTVLSVTIDGSSQTVSNFTVDRYRRELIFESSRFNTSADGAPNVTVVYEAGHDAPPADLKREMLDWTAARCASAFSRRPINEISETFDGRTVRFSTPDPARGRPTGVLALDPILVRLDERVPIA